MKKMAISTLLAVQLIAPNMTFAQSNKDYSGTYLCIADASGGIRYDDASNQWVGTRFNTDKRYILTAKANGLVNDPIFDLPKMTYIITWKQHGANWDEFMSGCWTVSDELRKINPMSSYLDFGSLNCRAYGGPLTVNFNNLRFMSTYLYGFVDGMDNNENTPFIHVGKCTKID